MFGRIIKSKSNDFTYLSLSRRFVTRYECVNWEEAKLYFLHPTEERNLLPPRQRQFSVAMLQWLQTICRPSKPVGCEIHACVDSLGKIESYRIFNVLLIKIILFESVSVLCCVFQISFGARPDGKIGFTVMTPPRYNAPDPRHDAPHRWNTTPPNMSQELKCRASGSNKGNVKRKQMKECGLFHIDLR